MNLGASDRESEVSDKELEVLDVKSEISAAKLKGLTRDRVMVRLLVALDRELIVSNKWGSTPVSLKASLTSVLVGDIKYKRI